MEVLMKNTLLAVSVSAIGLFTFSSSNATLIDRGGGLIYDDVLDVTWLQDASYSQTSGASTYGHMNWNDASTWVSNLQYEDTARGVMWDDWRLPTTINSEASLGYDLSGLSSELAYMYYVNLGYDPNYSHDRYDPAPESDSYNPFTNLIYRAYWSGTLSDYEGQAWLLHFHFGSQELNSIDDVSRVWALRDGDVAAVGVPEPGSLALFGVALAAFGVGRRRKV